MALYMNQRKCPVLFTLMKRGNFVFKYITPLL